MTEPVTVAVATTVVSPGIIAGALGFITGLLLSWPALIGLAFIGILFEHNGARGWSVFTALVVAATSYFFFSVPLTTICIGSAIYIAVGLIWSFWRYKRHADKVVEANRDAAPRQKDRAIAELHPKAMLGTITAWIIIWPFSMVENIIGDLISAIQLLVQKIFRGIYHRIYESAIAALVSKE